MFPENGNVKADLNEIIINDLQERKDKACETWDVKKTLGLPWGAKVIVNPEYAEEVETYFNEIAGNEIQIDDERNVKIIRGGLKERKGKYTLIFRYQLLY